jgi:hypothetical protein
MNAKPKGIDIQLWRTASPKTLIKWAYHTKRKTAIKRMDQG